VQIESNTVSSHARITQMVGNFEELALLNMDSEELAAARGGKTPSPPVRMGG